MTDLNSEEFHNIPRLAFEYCYIKAKNKYTELCEYAKKHKIQKKAILEVVMLNNLNLSMKISLSSIAKKKEYN